MTGRIKTYDNGSSSGCIESDTGQDIQFDAAVVVAYDVSWLAVGQTVTFQQSSAGNLRATYVSVETPRASNVEAKKEPTLFLRYLGFDQKLNIRSYRFERVLPGDDNTTFTVTTDLSIFAKHNVGIQEGPHLCRNLLMTEIGLGLEPHLILTEDNLLTFLSNRVIPREENLQETRCGRRRRRKSRGLKHSGSNFSGTYLSCAYFSGAYLSKA